MIIVVTMYPLGGITCYLLGFCVLLIKPHVFQNCGKQNKPFFLPGLFKTGDLLFFFTLKRYSEFDFSSHSLVSTLLFSYGGFYLCRSGASKFQINM